MTTGKCPFNIGDVVVFTPQSPQARAYAPMLVDGTTMEEGKSYKIMQIVNDFHLVLEGFEDSPGGGYPYTEFSASS